MMKIDVYLNEYYNFYLSLVRMRFGPRFHLEIKKAEISNFEFYYIFEQIGA